MKINRDVLPSKWLVAAILVSSAQFTIAPRPAQAKCGDYVMLGRHATHPPPMAADHVEFGHVGYGHVGYGTRVNDTAGREHLAAQILIHAALTYPVATHPGATHPGATHPGATHNRPLQGGQCSGPMCSNNDPRPLGAPPSAGRDRGALGADCSGMAAGDRRPPVCPIRRRGHARANRCRLNLSPSAVIAVWLPDL